MVAKFCTLDNAFDLFLWIEFVIILSVSVDKLLHFEFFSFFQGGTIAIQSVLDRPDFFTGAIFSAPSVKADPAVATACLVRDNSQNYKKKVVFPSLASINCGYLNLALSWQLNLDYVSNNWLLWFVEGDVYNITINI